MCYDIYDAMFLLRNRAQEPARCFPQVGGGVPTAPLWTFERVCGPLRTAGPIVGRSRVKPVGKRVFATECTDYVEFHIQILTVEVLPVRTSEFV